MSRTWAFFERVRVPDVNNPAEDHMVRWRLIQTPAFGISVHRFNTPDDARPVPHTHPWGFVSLVLRGGYTEYFERRRPNGQRMWARDRSWKAGKVHYVRASDAHAIRTLRRRPTWTLVLIGPRHREPSWGYWEYGLFTPWDQHLYAEEFAAAQAARDNGYGRFPPLADEESRQAPSAPDTSPGEAGR